jgi:serine/threonine protein kinase
MSYWTWLLIDHRYRDEPTVRDDGATCGGARDGPYNRRRIACEHALGWDVDGDGQRDNRTARSGVKVIASTATSRLVMTSSDPSGDQQPVGAERLLARLRARFAGRYTVEQEITGGGMSRVFLATDVALARRVVIKILPPGIAAEMNRDRFRREIQFAARLQHPHIVPVLAAGEEDDLLYYTMPYIEPASRGATFGEPLSVADAVDILRDVTDALAYAHREGIVHRDIKPANILLRDGHALITDFGVAKALASALDVSSDDRSPIAESATTTGLAIGTPAYMAPEQLAGDVAADHRVDIYALGLFAYELLTARRPFSGPSPQAMLAAQLTAAPAPITETRRDVPPVLVALIERCLEKDAHRRPNSAEAVLEVLKTLDVSGATRRFDTSVPNPPIAETRTVRRAVPALIGVAVLLAAGFVGSVLRKRSTPPTPAVLSVARPDTPATATIVSIEQRIIGRLRDSIATSERRREQRERMPLVAASPPRKDTANAVPANAPAVTQALPSSSQARELADRALAAAAAIAQVSGSSSPAAEAPPRPIGPEDFMFRRDNMGPVRRVAVLVSSQIQNPDAMIAAGALRDTVRTAISRVARFQLVSEDAIRSSRAASSNSAAVRVTADAGGDMYVLLNAARTSVSGDSIQWVASVADLAVHPNYRPRSASSGRLALAAPLEFDRPKLLFEVLQHLEQLDRAPRK